MPACVRIPDSTTDLLSLSSISDSSVLSTLIEKFNRGDIYSWLGCDILISLNPNRPIPSFYDDDQHSYIHQVKDLRDVPHAYAIAEQCLRRMSDGDNLQAIVISGLSGSGKTEASKYILRHLIHESSHRRGKHATAPESVIEEVLLNCNPVLEAFGNAHTNHNNNSSRFGKFLSLIYDANHTVIKGNLHVYLLEKPRAVFDQQSFESSFHIFHSFLASLSLEELKILQINSASRINLSSRSPLPPHLSWSATRKAFELMGYSEEAVSQIRQLLTAILLLNLTRFIPCPETKSGSRLNSILSESYSTDSENLSSIAMIHPEDNEKIKTAGLILGVSSDDSGEKFGQQLLHRVIQAGSSSHASKRKRATAYASPCSVYHAREQRDCLVKALYSSLFEYIVDTINDRLGSTYSTTPSSEIGILDFFGFERFQDNGFEQFCINYANERLHQYFMRIAVTGVVRELENEGILGPDEPAHMLKRIHTTDNQRVLDAMRTCTNILDEVCALNRVHATLSSANDPRESDWLQRLRGHFKSHDVVHLEQNVKSTRNGLSNAHPHANTAAKASPIAQRSSSAHAFTIDHFAGPVAYTVKGFVAKNLDRKPSHLLEWLSSFIDTSNGKPSVLQTIVMRAASSSQSLSKDYKPWSTPNRALSNEFVFNPVPENSPKLGSPKRRLNTVFGSFKSSVDTLLSNLGSHRLSFVRCIRPCTNNSVDMTNSLTKTIDTLNVTACKVDELHLREQLANGGLICAMQVLRSYFPARLPYKNFIHKYGLLARLAPMDYHFVVPSLLRQHGLTSFSETAGDLDDKMLALNLLLLALDISTLDTQSDVLAVARQCGRTRIHLHAIQLNRLDSIRSVLRTSAARRIQRAYLSYRERCTHIVNEHENASTASATSENAETTVLTVTISDRPQCSSITTLDSFIFATHERHFASYHHLERSDGVQHLWNQKRVMRLHCLIPYAWRSIDGITSEGLNSLPFN